MTSSPAFTETYISVDIETAGPHPGRYALLSIGACTVEEPQETFYVELRPTRRAFTDEALQVSGLSLETLAQTGLPPEEAMQRFAAWVEGVTPAGGRPVFVGLNAPFDWSFVNEYFHHYLGRNPFGHSALDIKALSMGVTGGEWKDTSFGVLTERCGFTLKLTHNALQDALQQAKLFRCLLDEARTQQKDGDPTTGQG